jgi:hypothetical protein
MIAILYEAKKNTENERHNHPRTGVGDQRDSNFKDTKFIQDVMEGPTAAV